MTLLLAIAAGLSLSAACGLRVFLPLLAASIGARYGFLHPSPGFTWLASPTTSAMLAVATVAEIAAFFSPWIVHALDVIALPVSIAAGAVVAASAFGDLDPAVRWTAALIAGTSAAGLVHAGTAATRAASSTLTAGAGNRGIALAELLGAAVLSSLAILVPVVAVAALVVIVVLIVRRARRRRLSTRSVK